MVVRTSTFRANCKKQIPYLIYFLNFGINHSCGDMKALAVVLGLSTNFGSCSFPCVKCYKPRKRDGFQCHYDTDDASVASCPYWRGSAARRDWAAAASMDRSRSSFSKKPEEHRGHLRERLFPFAFPNDNDILCDTLHSMLRIVDKLLASLLELVSGVLH